MNVNRFHKKWYGRLNTPNHEVWNQIRKELRMDIEAADTVKEDTA